MTKEQKASYARARYAANPERLREIGRLSMQKRRLDPKKRAQINAQHREYRKRHPELVQARHRSWYLRDTARILSRHRAYYRKNRARLIAQGVVRTRNRRRADHAFRLRHVLAKRIWAALQPGIKKSMRTRQLLGCTPAEFKAWIEDLFLPGMRWQNRSLWHIDHIKPVSSFDLTTESGQRAAFHYSNFRPLWARDNLKKGAKQTVDMTANQVDDKHMDQKFLDGADYGIKSYAEKNSGNAPGLNSPAGGSADLTKGCRLSGCGGSEQSIDSVQASSDVLRLISQGSGPDLGPESKRINSPGATAKN